MFSIIGYRKPGSLEPPYILTYVIQRQRSEVWDVKKRKIEEGRKEKQKGRRRKERIKSIGKGEKEGKALLLSLSRLKSRISLTWEPNLSNTPPPPLQILKAAPNSNTNSLITVTGHAAQAETAHKHTRTCSKSHYMHWGIAVTRHTLTRYGFTFIEEHTNTNGWMLNWQQLTDRRARGVSNLRSLERLELTCVNGTSTRAGGGLSVVPACPTFSQASPSIKAEVSQGAQS